MIYDIWLWLFCIYKADEVEALAAIYGDDWCVDDAVDRRYSININDASSDTRSSSIQLQVPSVINVNYYTTVVSIMSNNCTEWM